LRRPVYRKWSPEVSPALFFGPERQLVRHMAAVIAYAEGVMVLIGFLLLGVLGLA
jgi:hypothetical protein